MTTVTENTWGWFSDPYHEHECRYFSEGNPTKLVRDAGLESFDPPPDFPMPEAPVPAISRANPTGGRSGHASGRRRRAGGPLRPPRRVPKGNQLDPSLRILGLRLSARVSKRR